MLGSIPPELIIGAFYGVILFFVAIGRWLEKRTTARKEPNSTVTAASVGIGLGYGERDQTERMIDQLKRIADALHDKNAEDVSRRIDRMVETIDELRRAQDVLGMRAPQPRRSKSA